MCLLYGIHHSTANAAWLQKYYENHTKLEKSTNISQGTLRRGVCLTG